MYDFDNDFDMKLSSYIILVHTIIRAFNSKMLIVCSMMFFCIDILTSKGIFIIDHLDSLVQLGLMDFYLY